MPQIPEVYRAAASVVPAGGRVLDLDPPHDMGARWLIATCPRSSVTPGSDFPAGPGILPLGSAQMAGAFHVVIMSDPSRDPGILAAKFRWAHGCMCRRGVLVIQATPDLVADLPQVLRNCGFRASVPRKSGVIIARLGRYPVAP